MRQDDWRAYPRTWDDRNTEGAMGLFDAGVNDAMQEKKQLSILAQVSSIKNWVKQEGNGMTWTTKGFWNF